MRQYQRHRELRPANPVLGESQHRPDRPQRQRNRLHRVVKRIGAEFRRAR